MQNSICIPSLPFQVFTPYFPLSSFHVPSLPLIELTYHVGDCANCKAEHIYSILQWRNLRHCKILQESPAVADKPARRLRKVRTVYVRAVGL